MTLLNWAQIFIDLLEGVVHKFLPLIFISVNLFLPLKVQHLPVCTAEHGPQESGSSNQLPGLKESISNLNWQ